MSMNIARRQMRASRIAAFAASFSGDGGNPAPQSPPSRPTLAPSPGPSGRYPNYNTNPIAPDPSGMTSSVADIASRVQLGINIGETMEAIGGETGWGNPRITQALINSYKAAGFDAIRLPCAWDQYSNASTAKISSTWLDRVKQVVQNCVDANLYVLLNIHWDGGWLENNVTPEKKDSVVAKQKAFWEQIATKMRDFDQRVMFASANEPNCDNATQMDVLYAYHQTFIDAVRATGGKNAYRVLVLQLPNVNMDLSKTLWTHMPTDTVKDRLMVEPHFYTPPNFCILTQDASWGKMFYYWGKDYHSTIEPDRNATWGEEDYLNTYFAGMKAKFVDKGIPFLMGEYGAYRRTNPKDLATHNDAVDYWITFNTKQAIAHGMKPFFWETGGMVDRTADTVKDARTVNAIFAGTH